MTSPTDADLDRLIGAIDTLSVDIAAHKAALVVADRRSRWARTAALVGILVGIVGVAVGIGGTIYGRSARTLADTIARDRAAATISGCVQANVATKRTRQALVAGVSVLDLPDPARPPERQQAIDRFVAQYTSNIEAALPYRDCSPTGIAAYYDHPPADPATTK